MKSKTIFLGGLLFYCLNSFATQIDITVYFSKDSYQIDPAVKTSILTWASTHYQHRHNKVYLRGHTDQDAENDYNITLSKNRNNAVKELLESRGFTNIVQQHFGEDRLVCNSPDESCMCKNRRVEIVLMDDAYELWEESSILPEKNILRLDLSQDQIVVLPQGTKIHFYKNSIVNTEGEVVTNPIFEIRELYSINESILGNVTTECAGELLQSGGMIEVRAYSGSEELQLAPGATFDVAFKNNSQEQEDMQPFYGKVVNGKMTWQTEKQQGINKRASLVKSNLNNSDPQVITQNGNLIFFPKKMGSHVILKKESNKKYLEDLMRRPADKIYYADLLRIEALAKESEPEVKEEIKKRAAENYQLLDAKGNDMILYVLTEIDINFLRRQAVALDSLKEFMKTPMELVKFGWINCDRFMKSKEALVNNKCIVNSEIQFTSMLMIPETFSLMSSYSEYNEFTFINIPLRFSKTVICTHKLDDGKILFGYAQFPENSMYVEIDEFETLTSQEFEEKIKYLASL